MSTIFDATALVKQYEFLDEFPDEFLPLVLDVPHGELSERVAGVRAWRSSLLAGQMPSEDTWPTKEIAQPVRAALQELGIARFCKGEEELVDVLLKDILVAFAERSSDIRSEVMEKLHELETIERQRLVEEEKAAARAEKRRLRKVVLDEKTRQRLRQQAEEFAKSLSRGVDGKIIAAWEERVRAWSEISEVFGDLADLMGRGWDLSQGVLRHTGWLKIKELHALIKQLPQVREIVQSLGRLQTSENNQSVAEKIFVPVRRMEEELREIVVPLVPAETRGVERSGEIARMLPSEAAMLGHPKMRLLWHARRAERSLLTYRVEGTEIERIFHVRETLEEREGKKPPPERGPIIAVIDTSGSMKGVPEQVAKAIVLEAVRTAHAEKRRCYLYAYSGPGEILEHELDLSWEGIEQLMFFLSASFGGGTDIEVMSAVVEQLHDEDRGWEKADVVLLTDGEWRASKKIISEVQVAKDKGTRFHGVQIGNTGRTGLHDLCEPVHVFEDWAHAAGRDF